MVTASPTNGQRIITVRCIKSDVKGILGGIIPDL